MNQFYEAIRDRLEVLVADPDACPQFFPPPWRAWESGTIGGLVDNGDGTITLTDSTKIWPLTSTGACTGKRWTGYTCTGSACGIPANYDCIIEGDSSKPADVLQFVHSPIVDHTSTTTVLLNSLPIKNAVTAKFIPSINALIGKKYYFIKQGKLWWHERRPIKPADQELWVGTLESGWIDSSGNGTLRQVVSDYNSDPYDNPNAPNITWTADLWKNTELMAFDSSGLLRRIPIKGNALNRLGIGKSTYKLTISSDCILSINGVNTATIHTGATASAVQSALTAIIGAHVTVTLSGPYKVQFDSTLATVDLAVASGGATIGKPDDATALSGQFQIINAGDKQMPGRGASNCFRYYSGIVNSYVSHNIDDTQGSMNKPALLTTISYPDLSTGCLVTYVDAFDGDPQVPLDDECECGRALDYLAPDVYKTWRMLQNAALGLITSFVDPINTFGDGTAFRMLTAATAFYYANINAWKTTLTYSSGVYTVSSSNSAPYYPISVYYAVEDSHGTIVGNGTGTITNSGGTIRGAFSSAWAGFVITLSFGFTRHRPYQFRYLYPKYAWIPDEDDSGLIDPPAITPGGVMSMPDATKITFSQSPTGGTLNYNTTYYYCVSAVNGSGETMASSQVGMTTGISGTDPVTGLPYNANTYAVTISWAAVAGASSYNVYGRTSGGELLIGSTSSPSLSFLDDGSITPAGALPAANTTHNDCFGAGMWIKRAASTTKTTRSPQGFIGDGTETFINNKLYRYVGDNFNHPFSGQGILQTAHADAPYWDRLYRGTFKKTTQSLRDASRSGTVTASTTSSITDNTKNWLTDGINSGELRIHGGTATGGSGTTLVDSAIVTGQHTCWFSTARFPTIQPYQNCVIEIYKHGLPAGWTVGADGTTTWLGAIQPAPDFKTYITAVSGSTITIAAATGLAVASGDGYLIREGKYEVEKWEGRTVTFATSPPQILDILASDNNSIIFAPQANAIPLGTSYTINEYHTAAVLRFVTAQPAAGVAHVKMNAGWFVEPSGTDSRGGAPFLSDLSANLEDIYTDYGFVTPDDLATHFIPNEIYAILNLLKLLQYGDQLWAGGPGSGSTSWDSGGEWTNVYTGMPTAGGFPNPQCDLSLYAGYGVDNTGAVKYQLTNVVGTQSISMDDGPPYAPKSVPAWDDSINCGTIENVSGDISSGYMLEGTWSGPTSNSAYLAGRFVGNCKVPNGNGVTMKLYVKATFTSAGSSDPHFSLQSTYDAHGGNVGGKDQWFNFDTVTTSNMDPLGGTSPQDGSYLSALVGVLDTGTVTVPSLSGTFTVPPLPPMPTPPCPQTIADFDDRRRGTSQSGFTVVGNFGLIDWTNYLEYI